MDNNLLSGVVHTAIAYAKYTSQVIRLIRFKVEFFTGQIPVNECLMSTWAT